MTGAEGGLFQECWLRETWGGRSAADLQPVRGPALEFLELFDQAAQAFFLINLGEALLFGRWRDDAAQPGIVERGSRGDPIGTVGEPHRRDETGHRLDRGAIGKTQRG